jgi:ZIP family zinc transporter
MAGLVEVFIFSAVMGLSIYLSLPLVMSKTIRRDRTILLNAVAVGILVFLIGDVFSDVSSSLYNGSLYGYGTSPSLDLTFTASLVLGFLLLLMLGERSRGGLSPTKLSLLIALGIGFQNLTEGLVFGSLGSLIGVTGITLVVLLGFTLQNATEGFPIASPFIAKADQKSLTLVVPLLLVGGLPTILGAVIGYYYNSTAFDTFFDGLAIGGILYVILPIFKTLFRETSTNRTIYLGIFLGFIVGFAVNLL